MSQKHPSKLALAQDALNRNDAAALFALFEQSQADIVALLRMQAMYVEHEGKSHIRSSEDLETVKTIAMEAMSMAKMIIQERKAP